MSDRVAVVISTYNGEKYLKEQLDSILAQTGVDVCLFIRDDASTDSTKSILQKYEQNNSNVSVTYGENFGVGNSFMSALYNVPNDFDYYAFADQDDIWLNDKLSVAIEKLKSSNNVLYGSNQECTDKEGRSRELRYTDSTHINLLPEEIMCSNMIAGCTMFFTNELFEILTDIQNRPSFDLLYNRIHDVWVAFVASLNGGIYYDKQSHMLYRQHENNVVGVKHKKGERIKKIRNKKLRCGRSLLASEGVGKFEVAKANELVMLSANAKSFNSKIKLLKKRKVICSITGENPTALAVKILAGLY